MANYKVTELAKFMGLTEEEILNTTYRKVLEMEKAMWNQRKAAEAKVGDDIDTWRSFFRSYDTFAELFGRELTDKYLQEIPLSSLLEEVGMEGKRTPFQKPHVFKRHGDFLFTAYRGEYKKEEWRKADIYSIPNKYQSTFHGTILSGILLEVAPWLKDFTFNCYSLEYARENPEFYVNIPVTEDATLRVNLNTGSEGKKPYVSLYVPYKSFMAGDFNGIWQRTTSYGKSYYREKWQHMEDLLTASPEFAEFKKNVEQMKK